MFFASILLQGQSGLRGEYFDSPTLDGVPALERVDERIDFDWSRTTPAGLLPDGGFSVRWTGWIELPATGSWLFHTPSGDGVRLWLDGQLLIDRSAQDPAGEGSGLFAADRAGWHALELDYFNDGGTGLLALEFEGPRQERMVVPASSLCSTFQCAESDELTVDAGPDRVLTPPDTEVALEAVVSGRHTTTVPDSLTVRWSQTYGPLVTFSNRNSLETTVSPAHPGLVKLQVVVTDPIYGVVTDEVQIQVFGEDQDAVVAGLARKWDKLALTFTHDQILSEQSTPNPFLDYRLTTTFFHPASNRKITVPGFFACDGNAAETGAFGGRKWITNFAPDAVGRWYYLASFRAAPNLALDPNPTAGIPVTSFNNANGSFVIGPADPKIGGFVSRGRLEYVGRHHLQFAETKEFFLKGGTDSPENFLGYYEFDGTLDTGGAPNDLPDGLHHFDAHLGDWIPRGIPTWQGDKGRRIFGAIDYLASRGVNSLYALTYNIDGGDGREVFPWIAPFEKLRFDVSKLAQWERVVDHMMRAGVAWHVVTQETENDRVLDFGELGVQRKLYYRELIARFGHAGGLFWNLGEENNNTAQQRMAFADYLHEVDPYDHPVTLHNHNGNQFGSFTALLGNHLEMVSMQADPATVGSSTRTWVDSSASAGRPWIVTNDEQGPANDGVVPDAVDFWHDSIRTQCLWPNLMAQGGGCEWYFGYAHPNSDLDCEDFRSRDQMWILTGRALDFMRRHLPFADMHHADELLSGASGRILALPGEFYAVYLPQGGTPALDLESHVGPYLVGWFDPRNGGTLQDGPLTSITGPGIQSLGAAPSGGDWVAFVRRAENLPPAIASLDVEIDAPGVTSLAIKVHAGDPNGPYDSLSVRVRVQGPATYDQTFNAIHRGGSLYSLFMAQTPALPQGPWTFTATATDSGGLSTSASTVLTVGP